MHQKGVFTMRIVTVAAVQMACSPDVQENLETANRLYGKPPQTEPISFCCQNCLNDRISVRNRQYDYYSYATPLSENPAVQMFQEVAAELHVVLPISFYERAGNNTFNSIAILDADGSILGCYRKTHIPDDHFYQEKFYFTPR